MNITLVNGTVINTSDIFFNPDNLAMNRAPVFTYIPTGLNLDNQIRLADMSGFEGWNGEAWTTYRLAHPAFGTPVLTPQQPTGVGGILFDQLTTNPLAAPLDALSAGVKQIFASPGVKSLLWLGVGAIVLVLLLKNE
jgi:hypothetical protein